MKILVVDDTEAILLLISRFVEALGHKAILARNGVDAIEQCRLEQPDLVLMDVMMPIMTGPEAAIIIKAESGERWVPIVFVTGIGEENALADAIERGADDYINKPVNFRVLEAKLKAFGRTLELNRKVREQSERLADYYENAEEEKRVVRHLMEQLVNSERLSDPQLQYLLSPAESLSGDLIASARTPGQALHVMLADGIGHGLTAALNVLPLTQPFYSMTEKGYAISDILLEMNDKVRQVLPVGRFVCVTLISIDETTGCIEVWNGGMPMVYLVNEQGDVVSECRSKNLPLGIIPSHSMDFSPERFYSNGTGYVVACSDGLIEARNQQGEEFGTERLLQLLKEKSNLKPIEYFQETFLNFLQQEKHHDDVSLVLASFGANPNRDLKVNHHSSEDISQLLTADFATGNQSTWRYNLVLTAEELRYVNTIPFMMTFVKEIKSLASSQSDVFLILTELFVNAVDHGLLGMDSRMKMNPDGMENYLTERVRRLAELEEGRIEIDLMGVLLRGHEILRIRVKDSGEGFDWSRSLQGGEVIDAVPEFTFGRGISLVKALALRVNYVGIGNEVEVYYAPQEI
ncbi:fused response regulator/phosphatase [Deefgea piscis]|uniref:Fused response regulator/phosphatase n=1 Tax=Deefgea piscis TaxID=2739061 RepID=A0A6M8SKM8_9NEIS|nr:fused response regulator/phosphatase [Deefgea piscis]QKJ65655.1 fused response regulator/phosphatase [Deefgea piscis]